MKKFKKIIGLSLAALMTVGSLAACGGGNSSSSKDGGKGEAIELWTAYTEGSENAGFTKDMVKEFEKETGLKVNQTNFTYDMMHDKILASAAGGNLPDVIYGLPENVGEFYNMGILEDLTKEFEAREDIDQFSESVVDAMKIDGKVVGYPYEATVRGYLVHDDDFKKAGAEVPKTWEDVLALNDFEGKAGVYPYSFAGAGVREPQELIVYLAQYGLKIAEEQGEGKFKNTWNDNKDELEKATKVFRFYKDMVDKKVVNPSSANWGWEETDENFATGAVASYVTGNWLKEREESNPDTMDDVSVHAIPYPADGQEATYLEAKPIFVLKGTKNREGAIELAETITSKKFQETAFADRSPLKDVSTDTKWSKDYQVLQDKGISFPPITVSNVSQNMIDSVAKVLQDKEDPEAVAKWLSDAINKSLEESGEFAE